MGRALSDAGHFGFIYVMQFRNEMVLLRDAARTTGHEVTALTLTSDDVTAVVQRAAWITVA